MPDTAGPSQDLANIALPWAAGGFSVIPILPDGTKRPSVRWSDYMRRRMDDLELDRWWGGGSDYGVAVVCGAISGNAEMLELEGAVTDAGSLFAIRQECVKRGIVDTWDAVSLAPGYSEWTPSGGLHMIYRVADHEVPGNEKVAQAADGKTLVETRGEGGYTIVAPSTGRCHLSGESWETVAGEQGKVLVLSWAERCKLHEAIRAALHQLPEREVFVPATPATLIQPGTRPGDAYNAIVSWHDILVPQGWTVFGRRGREVLWTRPDKDPRAGHSATTGHSASGDRMYVFSSSAGLPTEEPLSKFFVYAHYHHGGDMRAATRELVRMGFGDPLPASDDLGWETSPVTREVAVPVEGGPIAQLESQGKVPLWDDTETDVGNADRLDAKVKGLFGYNHIAKRWMKYVHEQWVYEDTDELVLTARQVGADIMAEAREMAANATTREERRRAEQHYKYGQQSQSDGKIRAMMRQLASYPGIAITTDMLDQSQGVLNVRNGLLHLDTWELEPHRPEHYMTQVFNADYDPDAKALRFEAFMADLFPDELAREYCQRALGYALLGEANQRAFFMLHGPSGTGKSTLTRLMRQLFGDYGYTAAEATFQVTQSESTSSLHELRGKRFVATSELPRDAGMNETLLKRITGRDEITSRTLYQREQSWIPQCVLFVATNHLPRISGDDDALWRRAKVLEMGVQFGVDGRPDVKNLDDQLLAEEAAGILNWLIDGARNYRLFGLEEPAAVKQSAIDYRNDVDPVAAFLAEELDNETLVPTPGCRALVSRVYARYTDYCQRNQYKPMGIRRVNQRMSALGFRSEKLSGQRHWIDLDLRTWGF